LFCGPKPGRTCDGCTIPSRAAGRVTSIRYIERIEAYCRGFDYASERGTRHDEVRPGLRIVGFERRVSIAFRVETDEVVIFRIFYGGANWADEFIEDDGN
jgi:plasmid stabilization system protein ParE